MLDSERLGVEYHVEQLLGRGTTANAYLATRVSREGSTPVVIKMLSTEFILGAGRAAAVAFKKEAVALGRLSERVPPTPFVVGLVDVGEASYSYLGRSLALPWLALEYVPGGAEGTRLEERVGCAVRRTGFAFECERVERLVQHLAAGLGAVHAAGILHRDLTPNNVLCCGGGESELFKLSDFGLCRPHGVASTFGTKTVGTVGYAAPEQVAISDQSVGIHSDVFSFAAVVYHALTGEHYFAARGPVDLVSAVRAADRRSITASPALCPELREHPAACGAIDLALEQATAFDPTRRPRSAGVLAGSLLPWLVSRPKRPQRELWMTVMEEIAPTVRALGQSWTVRHPPSAERVIISAAWNAAGHALAATTSGLSYWDGTEWIDAPNGGLPVGRDFRFVRREGPDRWLVGTDDHGLCEVSVEGTTPVLAGWRPGPRVVNAAGRLGDGAVIVTEAAGTLSAHFTRRGEWLAPVTVVDAGVVNSVAQIDTGRWLLVGRDRSDQGWAGVYSPAEQRILSVRLAETKALLGASGLPDRHEAKAVGLGGMVLTVDGSGMKSTILEGAPALAAVALDVLGRSWVAATGRIWVNEAGDDWQPAWEDPKWRSPFVSLIAEIGFVAGMTVDGGVVECHSTSPSFGDLVR